MKIVLEVQNPKVIVQQAVVGLAVLVAVGVGLRVAFAQTPSGLTQLQPGSPISASQLNQNFAYLNGRIDTANANFATQIEDTAVRSAPPGMIVAYGGTKEPAGWKFCDGSSLDGSDVRYAALFDAIGKAWGGGSGSSFNLPDLRGRFLRGAHGPALDPDGNREVGSSQDAAFAGHTHAAAADAQGSHTHTGTTDSQGAHSHPGGHYWVYTFSTVGSWSLPGGTGVNHIAMPEGGVHYHNVSVSASGSHSHNLSVSAAGGAETRPVNAAVNYIIKL